MNPRLLLPLAVFASVAHALPPPAQIQLEGTIIVFDEAQMGKLDLNALGRESVLGVLSESEFTTAMHNWKSHGQDFREIASTKANANVLAKAKERAAAVKAVVALPPVMTVSGQRVDVAFQKEIRRAVSWSEVGKGKDKHWKPSKWRMEDEGLLLDVGPTYIPDTRRIDIHAKLNLRSDFTDEHSAKGDLGGGVSMPIDHVVLRDRETVVIGFTGPVPNFFIDGNVDPKAKRFGENRPVLVCLTARVASAPPVDTLPELNPVEERVFTTPEHIFWATAPLPANAKRSLLTVILEDSHGFSFPSGTSVNSIPSRDDSKIMVKHTPSVLTAMEQFIEVRRAAERPRKVMKFTVTMVELRGAEAVSKIFDQAWRQGFDDQHGMTINQRGGQCELKCALGELSQEQIDKVFASLRNSPGSRVHETRDFIIGGKVTEVDFPLIPDLKPGVEAYAARLKEWGFGADYALTAPVMKLSAQLNHDGHQIDLKLEGPQWAPHQNFTFSETVEDGKMLMLGEEPPPSVTHRCLFLIKTELLDRAKAEAP